MKMQILVVALGGALLVSPAASAQVQSQQQGGILQRLLGSVFGPSPQASEQTLESDWDQRRRPFEQRQAALEARIDAAIRDGSLSRGEADEMRREYYEIVRLEARYSENGPMSQQQRSDLRMRYRALTQRVDGTDAGQRYGDQTAYRDERNWQPLSMRNADFEQRVAAGLQNRSLTRAEALRLRNDWRVLGQAEANYRMGGIDSREQADLEARYSAIDSRLGGSFGGGSFGGFGADRDTARWSRMETRLATIERSGRMSRNEVGQLRLQLSDLARLDAAYAMGGYSADERSYLTRRYGDLDQMLGSNLR